MKINYLRGIPGMVCLVMATACTGTSRAPVSAPEPAGSGPSMYVAELDPIVTDRPDFTESAEVVHSGGVQLESGYTFDRSGEETSHTLGEVLVRVGIGHSSEVRLGFSSYSVVRAAGESVSGLEDTSLGAKVKLVEAEGLIPNTALLVGTSLPTGASAFREKQLQPEAKLALGWDLTDRVAFSSNLNYGYVSGLESRFHQFGGSASFGFSLTDRLGAYAEYYVFLPEVQDGPNSSYANGGVTYRFSPDFQLDVRGGSGLSFDDERYFFGLGVSRRW